MKDHAAAWMPAATGPGFGQTHFGAAELGDIRRTRRLVQTADTIMRHPGGTLPDKLGGRWAELMALYRMAASPRVTHQAVLAPHCRRTLDRAAGEPVVLFVHDATELDFTQLHALDDQLGQIGDGRGQGYICHNSLAVLPERREVLGLASQVLHKRRRVPRGESPLAKRQHPQRESLLWLEGCQAIGPAPAGRLWVDVCDRGADTFEFLDFAHRQGRRYLVRSSRDRRLAGEDHVGADRIHQSLHAYTRDLPDLGRAQVEVPRRQQGKRRTGAAARVAQVRLAAGPASVAVPHFCRGQCSSERLELFVVHVREVDPPPDVEPLEWILLTNLPTADLPGARERVAWYACREVVEEYHKGQKTGCGIEQLQFEYAQRLEPVVALLSVVAVELLRLRELARRPRADDTPADELIDPAVVAVLSSQRYGPARDPNQMSLREFAMALARLGGHLNRRGDGFPGWLTTWRGWIKLQAMLDGARIQRCV